MTILSVGVLGVTPVLAKPPGVSVLGEVTITEAEKPTFFVETIIPVGGDNKIDYGVYVQSRGDIGGDYQAGNAGGYVRFNRFPINQCGLTSFFGVTQDSQATGRVRVFCQF